MCAAVSGPRVQVLLYNPLRGTRWLSKACLVLMLLSFFFGITAVALMWRTSPNEYSYGGLLNDSMFFFRCLPQLRMYKHRLSVQCTGSGQHVWCTLSAACAMFFKCLPKL